LGRVSTWVTRGERSVKNPATKKQARACSAGDSALFLSLRQVNVDRTPLPLPALRMQETAVLADELMHKGNGRFIRSRALRSVGVEPPSESGFVQTRTVVAHAQANVKTGGDRPVLVRKRLGEYAMHRLNDDTGPRRQRVAAVEDQGREDLFEM